MMLEFNPDLPPMAAPPSLPRQQARYARILDVAAGFARKGIKSVTLPEVAAKADVPLSTLYRYFPSATHLMLALYRHQLSELKVSTWPGAGTVRIHALSERAVTSASGDTAISRVLLLTVTGLVQSVRCRRLSLFEAEEDLKNACSLLVPRPRSMRHTA
jgi:AcrR family transcriptional regulator